MKLDLKKKYKQLYKASSKKNELIEVPELNYLMIDGKGNPSTAQAFRDSVEALYSIAYTMKFIVKKKDEKKDYVVPPMEGLWWMGNNDYFDPDNKDEWKWTLMIAQPDFIDKKIFADAAEAVKKKKGIDVSKVRLEKYKEGESVQFMHIGPYSEEGENIKKMHLYMKDNGYRFNGKHHEIYLSNPMKTEPAKLKTIIRQPVKK